MNNITFTIVISLSSIIVGGIITWLCAKIYYVKAGKELVEETKEIRKLLNCMIILQQNESGAYVPKIDENGKLVTIYANMSANISGSSSLSATLTAKKAKE